MKARSLAIALIGGCLCFLGWVLFHKSPDHIFDASGVEIDCKGQGTGVCLAAHCLHDYETIEWRDLGGTCVYRCKP
jgi:hypothetical protein